QACHGEAVVTAARTHSEHSLLLLDPASGADKWRTVDWESALDLQPRITRPRPCGYWLAADAAPAVRRLREQGVQVRQLAENASAKGDEYGIATPGSAVTALKAAAGPLRHGGTPLVTIDALIDMPAGSYYVPLTQPLANLAIAALEPDAPASYVAAGVIADAAQVARVRVPPAGSFNDVP
ncbi:MAG TPA: peptidase M14, partial [Ideonella sp.]|nr:peptidase M14 [Ideonella sp.]